MKNAWLDWLISVWDEGLEEDGHWYEWAVRYQMPQPSMCLTSHLPMIARNQGL
jgi:hypothetical protein